MVPSRSSLLRAALAAAFLLISLPLPAAADAELVATEPTNGATLVESPDRISATFDEPLGSNSTIELRTAAGATLAAGGVDPADPATLSLVPPDLGDGTYEVRWTAAAADGHVTRGTFGFNVALPPTELPTTPPASETPAATTPPSPTALATPVPTPAPSAPPGEPTGGSSDALIPILAAVALLGGFGAYLLRRRGGSA